MGLHDRSRGRRIRSCSAGRFSLKRLQQSTTLALLYTTAEHLRILLGHAVREQGNRSDSKDCLQQSTEGEHDPSGYQITILDLAYLTA